MKVRTTEFKSALWRWVVNKFCDLPAKNRNEASSLWFDCLVLEKIKYRAQLSNVRLQSSDCFVWTQFQRLELLCLKSWFLTVSLLVTMTVNTSEIAVQYWSFVKVCFESQELRHRRGDLFPVPWLRHCSTNSSVFLWVFLYVLACRTAWHLLAACRYWFSSTFCRGNVYF